MTHNTPLNPAVAAHLADIRAELAAVRAQVPAGSWVWFLADIAHQAINHALKHLATAREALNRLGELHPDTTPPPAPNRLTTGSDARQGGNAHA
jgi:hypothetical protein